MFDNCPECHGPVRILPPYILCNKCHLGWYIRDFHLGDFQRTSFSHSPGTDPPGQPRPGTAGADREGKLPTLPGAVLIHTIKLRGEE